jgi:hypothetical protein
MPITLKDVGGGSNLNWVRERDGLERATGGKDAAFTGTLGSVPLHVEAAILAAGDDGFQPSVSWFIQSRLFVAR